MPEDRDALGRWLYSGAFAGLIGGAWVVLGLPGASGAAPYFSHEISGDREIWPLGARAAIFVAGWVLMSVAMMLPSSLPLVTVFHAMTRQGGLITLLIGGVPLHLGCVRPGRLPLRCGAPRPSGCLSTAAIASRSDPPRPPPHGRPFPIFAVEVFLPAAVSLSHRICDPALAGWEACTPSLRPRSAAWALLHRLLLGADAPHVRCGQHPSRVDACAGRHHVR